MAPGRRLCMTLGDDTDDVASGREFGGVTDMAPTRDGVAALPEMTATVATAGGGCEFLGVDDEKCVSMQETI